MTLAMSLGIRIGVRRTLWMMLGELSGITLVAIAVFAGVATVLLQAPGVFPVAKGLGALYLLVAAVRAWNAPSDLHLQQGRVTLSAAALVSQGFVTAVSNPKAWIFFAALLPPFVDASRPLLPQASVLMVAMLLIEFLCLLIYAFGGRVLRDRLAHHGLAHWLNRVSSALMAAVAVWLVMS